MENKEILEAFETAKDFIKKAFPQFIILVNEPNLGIVDIEEGGIFLDRLKNEKFL